MMACACALWLTRCFNALALAAPFANMSQPEKGQESQDEHGLLYKTCQNRERIMDMAGCYAIPGIHVQTSDKLHTCCV